MKKICLIILSLILCACHTTPQLEGTWKCEKSPLENKDIYTAYLTEYYGVARPLHTVK